MSGRVLYIDAFAGIAGDMLCAALLDLGADLDALRAGLAALPIDGYRLELRSVLRGPFSARRFVVEPALSEPLPRADDAHTHAHTYAHTHAHTHDHGHAHAHQHVTLDPWPGQPYRSWREIRALIEQSGLTPRVKARALAVFERLAIAEARVHGVPVDDVGFHEVGAVDSIVDVVGACLLLELHDVGRLVAGPLPMSTGLITTAHGRTPLPAPATLEILRGWPVVPGPPGREHVTPTGAALVAALAEPGPIPAMTVLGVGHGAGTRDPPDLPNVVRVVLGQPTVSSSPEQVAVIEAQMDDLPGEHLPPLIEALLEAGALDAFAAPVLMKKGRTGLWVVALATRAAAPAVERALLRHGSTFGVRRTLADRRVLDRRHENVVTPWGEIRMKLGFLDGDLVQASPEFEDVRAVARAADVPVPQVHAAAVRAFGQEKGS